MEEAISGPVDKDTSSYGERTGASSAAGSTGQMMLNIPANGNLDRQQVGNEQQQKSAADAGAELEREAGPIGGPGAPAPPTARGYPVEQATKQQQQQQMMMMSNGVPDRSGRLGAMMMAMLGGNAAMKNGRLQQQQQQQSSDTSSYGTASSTKSESAGFGDEQAPTKAGGKQAKGAANNGRANANGNGIGNGYFGKLANGPTNGEQKSNGMRSSSGYANGNEANGQEAPVGGYGGQSRVGENGSGANSYGSPSLANDNDEQQATNGNGGAGEQQEKSYEANGQMDEQQLQQQQQISAKQRATAATLMSMNDRMKYSRARGTLMDGMGASQYGDKQQQQPSSMARNMMMSLANKAAYMQSAATDQQRPNQQQQQYQRQVAPPVMMPMGGGYSTNGRMPVASNGNGGAGMRYGNGDSMTSYLMSGQANGGGAMRAMRRANQRKMEKKMSPAMVNAMLNKMLGTRVAGQEQQPSSPLSVDSNAGYSSSASTATMSRPAIEMMMKSPMGAEMLANMVINSNGAPSMNGMSANQREKYKRMMMAAIMQSGAGETGEYENGDGQQEQEQQRQQQQQVEQQNNANGDGTGAYGDRSNGMGAMSQATKSPVNNGLGAGASGPGYNGGSMMSTTVPPMSAVMMNTVLPTGGAYGSGPRQTMEANRNYGGRQQRNQGRKMMQGDISSYDNNNNVQQMEQQKNGIDSMVQQREMANGNGPTKGSTMAHINGGAAKPAMSYDSPSLSSSLMIDAKTMMMMNGMRNGGYANEAREQQRDIMPAADGGASAYGNEMMDSTQQQKMNNMGGQTGGNGAYTPMPSDSMSSGATGIGAKSAKNGGPVQQMNGFRQAYNQQQQQETGPENDRGYQSPAQLPLGTKSAEQQTANGDSYSAMARPSMSPMAQQQQQEQSTSVAGSEQAQVQQQDEYGSAPMGQAEPFAFDYKIEDDYGNGQYRKEASDKNGVVRGTYGYMDTSGIYRHVEYVADENGFRANIKSNEPGLSSEPAGTKGLSGMNPSTGARQAPGTPSSSSSSLGGASGMQQDTQLPMTPLMMDSGMQQLGNNQQQQQQQQAMAAVAYPAQAQMQAQSVDNEEK